MRQEIKNSLMGFGLQLLEVPICEGVLPPVAGHPDMQMVHIAENVWVYQPLLPQELVQCLAGQGLKTYMGETVLQCDYPFDIAYNIAIVGKKAFHHTKYTDRITRELLQQYEIELVHVNQGYAKCSVVCVSPESLITADPSIAVAAHTAGLDVLQIPVQKNIRLPGFDYGFIGGTAGFIDERILAFTGDPQQLDSFENIERFLQKYGISTIALGAELWDTGGILPLR